MRNKVYIGNLSYSVSEDEIKEFFGDCGDITDLVLIKDRETGRSKGFGFVTFDSQQAAESAVKKSGSQLSSRAIKVNLAQDKRERGGNAGSGGRGRW